MLLFCFVGFDVSASFFDADLLLLCYRYVTIHSYDGLAIIVVFFLQSVVGCLSTMCHLACVPVLLLVSHTRLASSPARAKNGGSLSPCRVPG